MTLKACKDCKQEKPLTEFYEFYSGGRKYYRQACKPCWHGRTAVYKASPKGKIAIAKRNLRNYYKQRFGLTEDQYREEYNARYEAQQGKCAICGKELELVLDHCHRTANLRELLCGRCNSAIGFMYDDPMIADAAAQYLRKHAANGTPYAEM